MWEGYTGRCGRDQVATRQTGQVHELYFYFHVEISSLITPSSAHYRESERVPVAMGKCPWLKYNPTD